jgi:hypothetical protein
MFITSVIVFGLTQLLPGDIARLVLGRDASQIALEEFREAHHLTDSIPEQYARWLGGFVTGDWGISFTRGVSPSVNHKSVGKPGSTGCSDAGYQHSFVNLSGVLAALYEIAGWTALFRCSH